MVIHFNTKNEAIDHLRKSDFRLLKNGFWLSPNRTVKASVHPTKTATVQVAYQQVYVQ
jgi:hypothetical protein